GLRYKINHNNDFELLKAIGHDCAGAVSFYPVGSEVLEHVYYPLKCDILSDEDLEKLINELPVRPYLGRRLSLAGVQEKTPICVIDDKMALPLDETPTTHILKPPLIRFKGSVVNEYICLKTAKAVGLTVPDVQIRNANSIEYFLIKRYDRMIVNNEIMRLHHEDFAQALGVSAADKYNVTYKDCLNVLNKMARPALEKMNFVSLAIFNYLIGNCDAHGKNYSILYLHNGPVLAPVYDVLCTIVYDLDLAMAMKIGKAKYIRDVSLKDWQNFSKTMEISAKVTFDELERQVNILPEELEKVVSTVNSDIGDDILKFVKNNCENIKKLLNI
ncbi:MAG: HipA domain-containing protein, partial [Vampirovibrionia bacterium]